MAGLKSRLALSLVMTASGLVLLGSTKANAQDCSSGCSALELRDYQDREAQKNNELRDWYHTPHGQTTTTQVQHIMVDTPENRQLANRIYELAFAEINKIMTAKGKTAALELSQHPERISELKPILEGLHEGQYLITQRIAATYLTDAKQYIYGNYMVSVHAMSDSRWKEITANVEKDLDSKDANTTEILYIKNCYESPNCYSPDNEKAAGLVISIYQEQQDQLRVAEAARQEQARIAQEESKRIEQNSIEQSRLEEQRVQEYLASETGKKDLAARTGHYGTAGTPVSQAPPKHASAQDALRELMKFLELPEKPLPHTHPVGEYYADYAGKMAADFHTVGDVDAYRLYVSTPSSSNWGIDESIFFPNSVGIQDKIQLPKDARCEVLVEGMAATMVDGKKYVIAHCMNVQYPGFVMPQLEVLVEPGTLK